jgi:hypothetical protein
MAMCDYSEANAELFVTARYDRWSRSPMTFRRFETLALAIAYACEDGGAKLDQTTIRTDAVDIQGAEIRRHYDSQDFPLPRHSRTGPPDDGTGSPSALEEETDGIDGRPLLPQLQR